MNILHISDLHFGPYHWRGDDKAVLDRLNEFPADIVVNTGDTTSDSLPDEFREGQQFLAQLKCPNVVSIIGNHDKYSKRSHEMFRKYIYDGEFIKPLDALLVEKKRIFINRHTVNLADYFTDVNFLRQFTIKGEKVLVVCIDTTMLQNDFGHVDEQILLALTRAISDIEHKRTLLLSHHSILSTDAVPLENSMRVGEFVFENNIEAVFCGHTHELDIVCLKDLVRGQSYRQFMCGSLSSGNITRDANMFCTYENFGAPDEKITVTRIKEIRDGIEFEQSVIGG